MSVLSLLRRNGCCCCGLGGGWSEATLTERAASGAGEEMAERRECQDGNWFWVLSLSLVLVRRKWK